VVYLPILPIDTGRYGTPEMRRIFEEENRFQKMLDVEAALALAQAELGVIPREYAKVIAEKASTKYVKIERIKEIEREIKHETMALVKALEEVCGEAGKYIHYGATSSDILDTALALQIKDALKIILRRLEELESTLMDLASKYKHTIMMGRTHGQHALPITLGFKFAIWLREISRHINRLLECKERVLVGKISGAVGTQASFGEIGLELQRLVMENLGLKPADISSQIIQRDIYAELVCLLALIASSLEKFSTEIRALQRTEIAELAEPFDVKAQIGSSTMPHKKNPIKCERICGLARIIRSLVISALENIITWNERDLTQSSAERFIIPEVFILTDYIVNLMIKILKELKVDEEKMKTNMEITMGRFMAESLMIELVKRGMRRNQAYTIVREVSLKSEAEKRKFLEVVLENNKIREFMSEEEIKKALKPENYLGTAIEQIEECIKLTEKERKNRIKF